MLRHPATLTIVDTHMPSLVSTLRVQHLNITALLSIANALSFHKSCTSFAEVESRVNLPVVEGRGDLL